jgi:biopolymer transport protein TolR
MGGGSAVRGRAGAITGINVTPLVDIVLVLLIIFMVTAKLIVNKDALTVDLPKAASGSEVQEIFSVVMTPGDTLAVNGSVVKTDAEFSSLARASLAKDKDVRAVLKADGAVPHAKVMHVLDLLRLAGIAKVAFGVVPEESKKP